jgi:hypothetical protein
MPRGMCDHCSQQDVFVYPVSVAFGEQVFICAWCLRLPKAKLKDTEDCEDDDSELYL